MVNCRNRGVIGASACGTHDFTKNVRLKQKSTGDFVYRRKVDIMCQKGCKNPLAKSTAKLTLCGVVVNSATLTQNRELRQIILEEKDYAPCLLFYNSNSERKSFISPKLQNWKIVEGAAEGIPAGSSIPDRESYSKINKSK